MCNFTNIYMSSQMNKLMYIQLIYNQNMHQLANCIIMTLSNRQSYISSIDETRATLK